MKALSIKQPWAWAIMRAGKDIENRDWFTNFRGTVAVHASKNMTSAEYFEGEDFVLNLPDNFPVVEHDNLVFGAILGTVEIVDCVKNSKSVWFTGDYGFVLQNPRPLITPIPCKGALGFWEVPKEIQTEINRTFGQ